MYIDVWELNAEQLAELKENYFYDILDETAEYTTPDEIPDDIIFAHYKHTCFTSDDFFCSAETIPLF